MLPQYTASRERYNSPGLEVSLQVPFGSSMAAESSLSAPVVQEGEAVRMVCCVSCRAILEMLSHGRNPYRSAAIKVLRFNFIDIHPCRIAFY